MSDDKRCAICGEPMATVLDLSFSERHFREARALCEVVVNRASSLSTLVLTFGHIGLRVARAANLHNLDALSTVLSGAVDLLARRGGSAQADRIRTVARHRTGTDN